MEMSLRNILLAIAIFIVIILGYAIEDAVSDVTSSNATSNQTNVSGGNTSIQGYEATTNNTYQGQVTNSTSNSTSNTTNQKTAVNSANAPAMSVYSQDSCSLVVSGSVSVLSFSFSGGGYVVEDENCARLKKVKLLNALGMKVAAISLLTQDYDVWKSMMEAGTPPPIDGLIGEQAKQRWEEVGGFYRTKEKNNEKYFTNSSNTNNSKFRHHR